MLVVWAIIAILVLVAAVLIYMEHDWGIIAGGSTAICLALSYFSTDLIKRSPLGAQLPNSQLDAFAVTAAALMVLGLIVIAYLAGRGNAADKKQQEPGAD